MTRELRYHSRAKSDVEKAEHVEVINKKLAVLKKERADDSPYLFMKRPLIDGFIQEIGGDLRRIGVL